MLAQNGCKIRMRTALMHKNGFAYSGREFKLTMKSLALYLRGRKIAVVVETALADGDDFRQAASVAISAATSADHSSA